MSRVRDAAYTAILIIIGVFLKLVYPSSLEYNYLQEPLFIILAAFMVWDPLTSKVEELHTISLISWVEVKFCGIVVLVISLITIYSSGISFGFEYVIINFHLISVGVISFFFLTWLLGSFVPRFLYKHGILKRKSIEPQKLGEPLGVLFG